MSTAQRDIRRKRRVLDYAERTGNIHPTDAGNQLIASIIAEMLPIDPTPAP